MPSVIKRQMYTAIANAIKRYYNRHGLYEYSSYSTGFPDESVVISFSSRRSCNISMMIRLPSIAEIGNGEEWTLVDVTSYDHRGEMIDKIKTAIAKKMLVGEIKLVSERASPIHVVMKMKRVGEKISTRTVSTEMVGA